MYIGESFIGEGVNAAHTNVVIGPKDGPAGTAFATALATPTQGHVPFLTVIKPGVPVKPFTLFVTKAEIDGELHGNATWGSAQAGLAVGIQRAYAEGLLPAESADDWVVIAACWINPGVDDLDESYRNQREAAYNAVKAAMGNLPDVAEVTAAAPQASNPFYTPKEV